MADTEGDQVDPERGRPHRTPLELYETALDAVAHGLCVFDADLRIALFNQRLLDLLGFSRAVVRVGLPLHDLLRHGVELGNFPGQSADEAWRRRAGQIALGAAFSERQSLANGRIVTASYRPTADGGWVAIFEDVTEQHRLDLELNEQVARFRLALDSMSHGLAIYDGDERLVVCNRQYLDCLGLDPAVVRPGISLFGVVQNYFERGLPPGRTAGQLYQDVRARLLAGSDADYVRHLADGRFVLTRNRPMSGGGWVVTNEDITEREQVAEDLREQQRRFDAALDSMSQGFSMFDAEDRLIVCNALYASIFRADPAVVKPGITLREVFEHGIAIGNYPGRTADELMRRRLAALSRGEPSTYDYVLGDGRTVRALLSPMPDGGSVGTFEDVTELRRMEAARGAVASELHEQHRRFDAALNNMTHGLVMFDEDLNLIVCNKRYLEHYGFSPDVVKPGIGVRDLVEYSVGLGNPHHLSVDDRLAELRARLRPGRPVSFQRVLRDRVIKLLYEPMPHGGWVAVHEDITEQERAARELREQHRRFDAALNNLILGLAMFDEALNLLVCNRRYLDMYGLSPEVVKPGASMREILEHSATLGNLGADSAELRVARLRAGLRPAQPVSYRRFVHDRIFKATYEPMEHGGWVAIHEDVTEQERADEALHEQHRRFDAALNNMAHGLAMFDEDLNLLVCNRRYLDLYGLSPEVVKPGAAMRDIVAHSIALGNYVGVDPDAIVAGYIRHLEAGERITYRELPDGRTIEIVYETMAHGGWVVMHEDVTLRRRAEQRIAHMAHHDALTNLPNRTLFRDRMAEGLTQAMATGEPMAVLCLDLDRFKAINDTLGHPVGDKLLRAVSDRLNAAIGPEGTIARLGGDEFAILLSATHSQAVEALAERMVRVMDASFMIDGHEVSTGLSIGIAMAPADGSTADHLMKCADLALYKAKSEGRGAYRFFDPDMSARVEARRALELDLRQALPAGEFHLVFQPQVRASNQALTGFEALLRWSHPRRGPVPPAQFIPVAEETGLILPIGEWVLHQAFREAARWPEAIRISVNLSPVQLRGRGFADMVKAALDAAGLAPGRLELEITEAVLLGNDEATTAELHDLRALGIRIAMDDFGVGYSSLSYLRSFPFDKIKIDRSFIADLDRNKDNAAIIRAIADLGASLAIETTAEGVETPEQLATIRHCGCTEVQGYLIGRPCPAEEALAFIRGHGEGPPPGRRIIRVA
ncbi:EAL domain-containing protein [Roseomonas hellenica]|uniref:EAL domain-containing protein n=1 Tax=Plastoroseomonas hellenica TaxID=2687306 RepID=A0ABS5F1L8_9PROT|nr:PAS-domain containing protein [Plastoroseomonas hellenica]MBR0666430.1 EAL domain-containing protein [Plastoroseomonas hellenica]